MKRMYATLVVMVLLIIGAGSLLAQSAPSFEDRIKMRQEMHRRMMDKLLHGVGPDQDMFQDMEKFMDEVMSDSFTSFSPPNTNFQMEWSDSENEKTLIITPNSPDQQLDINVKNGMIEIKGKTENKFPHGVSVSNFSNSFNVPQNCDATKVKMDQKDGKILVQFPCNNTKAVELSPTPGRKPLPPSESDIAI